jgi:hypothetical protein
MSPQSVALSKLILAQNRRWSDGKTEALFPATDTEMLDYRAVYACRLNALVENAIISRASRCPADRGGSEPAVAMTQEEERELREELARLHQEHRDLDAAIAALALSPGSDLFQVQRLKKRKLLLRDRIRAIEDQLTPDIIA